MTKLAQPSNKIIEQTWQAAFPEKTLPRFSEYKQGGTHHVVLLGNIKDSWEYMLRWDEAGKSVEESARLHYLKDFNPPVAIPTPLIAVNIAQDAPFNHCEILVPVHGVPLHEYWEQHSDMTLQTNIATQLGVFISWMNTVPFDSKFISETSRQTQDILVAKPECLRRLEVAGLKENEAQFLYRELLKLLLSETNFVPCHNDIYPQHILIDSNGNVGIVDWDDIGLNDPIKDFAMWYEPFDPMTVLKKLYSESFQAICRSYKSGFPSAEEERKLKLYALAGEFSYDEDETGQHVKDWLDYYRGDFI